MNENTRPLMVTIRCITYNHEPYIRQCLEGFVMQKTNFRFEAIVHDDASTDGTAAIVREYAEKYPDIIKPIFETENQYSKRDGSLRRIMDEHTHGKYVALCEGDDYWIDPLKLQKQVDFIENHPDYTMCFHNAIEHFENAEKRNRKFSNIKNRDYQDIEIFKKWIIPTASVLYKSEIIKTKIYAIYTVNEKMIVGDLPLFLTCCHYGKIRGLSDIMSVYRRHNGGVTAARSSKVALSFALFYKEIPNVFGSHLSTISEWKAIRCLLGAWKRSMLMKEKHNTTRYIKEAFGISIFKTIILLLKGIPSDLCNGNMKYVLSKILQ